ncbi:hypothetical protein NEIG_02037 [Nematocida sp. ERTm5]|nr:hypothetical protein NEIG_02037 [Nematocida sp. ERTm5]
MNKVEALIRIRPLSPEEKSTGIKQGWYRLGDRGIIQHLNSYGQEVSAQTLLFDWVFDEESKNEDLFTHINSTVDESLYGVNVCVIAYGQTSSGKTHTMKGILPENYYAEPSENRNENVHSSMNMARNGTGCVSDPGIIPKSLNWIFSKKTQHRISLSYVEVYNENIYDLLGDPSEPLQIRESADGDVYIKDVSEIEVFTKNEAAELFRKGNSIRKVSATRMNRESSRSHAVLKLTIRLKGVRSSLVFVDLAGSERVSSARTSGTTLKEGACINKSLLALTSVISKLSKKQAHIPYRDAKLTRLLQPSFSGSSKTVLICAISPTPSCIDETISTLSLASRARNIEIKPTQKPQVRKESKDSKVSHIKMKEITSELDLAKTQIKDIKEGINQINSLAFNICQWANLSLNSQQIRLSTLNSILKEIRREKEESVDKLSLLSNSVQYLLKQEEHISQSLKPAPDAVILLEHLAEGDAIIQQQRAQIEQLKNSKYINETNISMALEIDRLKKANEREKRIMQLEIAQLKSQIKSLSPSDMAD